MCFLVGMGGGGMGMLRNGNVGKMFCGESDGVECVLDMVFVALFVASLCVLSCEC